MKKLRKSKVGVVKNLKLEIKYLRQLKKIIIEKSQKYFNKGISYEKDLKIFEESIKDKNFDKENIFRVIIEEKKVLLYLLIYIFLYF
jgi:hypothetical protein